MLQRGRVLLRSGASRAAGPDILEGLSAAERAEVAAIHAALERIERGIYGRCESCAHPMATARLEAEPWQPLCAGCAASDADADAAEPVVSA